MEHGERRVMERGETLEEAGKPAQWVAFVEWMAYWMMPMMQRTSRPSLPISKRMRKKVLWGIGSYKNKLD